ncbi:hypothetical protein Peur_019319 [Populus x canadensis]
MIVKFNARMTWTLKIPAGTLGTEGSYIQGVHGAVESIFGRQKFPVEVLGLVSCHLRKEGEDEASINFRVDDFEEHRDFLVSME